MIKTILKDGVVFLKYQSNIHFQYAYKGKAVKFLLGSFNRYYRLKHFGFEPKFEMF